MSIRYLEPGNTPIELVSSRIEAAPGQELFPIATPSFLSAFIGRTRETRAVSRLLAGSDLRLLTITGPGGVGKTRLAHHALSQRGDSTDGHRVYWVPLATVNEPDEVIWLIARALGLRSAGMLEPMESIRLALLGRPTVIVLDTFEHLLDARTSISALLSRCPSLRIVITSRAPLRISMEQLYRVPPFELPAGTSISGARAGKSDAVRFFVSRASASDPDFVLTTESEEAVAELCRRLDGLPLAIELAAARIALFSPAELLARLDQRLPLLEGGAEDAPERHRTLRDAIAWSYDLLPPDEQRHFRWLACCTGGFTLETAERICQHATGRTAIPVLALLVDASLLQSRRMDERTRFEMLDTIREFGLEKLLERGEAEEARRAHAEAMLAFARDAEPHLFPSVGMERWLQLVEDDLDNLRAAFRWFERHEPAGGGRLASALAQFWVRRSMWREARQFSERVLALDPLPPDVRAMTMVDLARAMTYQFDFSQPDVVVSAFEHAAQLGGRLIMLDALLVQVTAATMQGQLEIGLERIASARPLLMESTEPAIVMRAWTFDIFEAALHARSGDLELGTELVARYLARAQEHGDGLRAALLLWASAGLAIRRGDRVGELRALQQALARYSEVRELWSVGVISAEIGVAILDEQPATAARLIGFGARLFGMLGLRSPIEYVPRLRDAYARASEIEGRSLDFAAYTEGLALDYEHGVKMALELDPTGRPEGIGPLPALGPNLTPREWQVLERIKLGRSDREIALELGISYRTTTTHVSSIFTKLDVPSRAAAAAWAARQETQIPSRNEAAT